MVRWKDLLSPETFAELEQTVIKGHAEFVEKLGDHGNEEMQYLLGEPRGSSIPNCNCVQAPTREQVLDEILVRHSEAPFLEHEKFKNSSRKNRSNERS